MQVDKHGKWPRHHQRPRHRDKHDQAEFEHKQHNDDATDITVNLHTPPLKASQQSQLQPESTHSQKQWIKCEMMKKQKNWSDFFPPLWSPAIGLATVTATMTSTADVTTFVLKPRYISLCLIFIARAAGQAPHNLLYLLNEKFITSTNWFGSWSAQLLAIIILWFLKW